MASRNFYRDDGTLTKGVVALYGKVVLGAAGVISSQQCDGFTVAKTAAEAGRYTITLQDKFIAVLNVGVNIVGATDAAYTGAKGQFFGLLRNIAVQTTSTFDVQLQTPTTQADAEAEDNVTLLVAFRFLNSTISTITS